MRIALPTTALALIGLPGLAAGSPTPAEADLVDTYNARAGQVTP